MTLEKAASGTADTEDIDRLVSRISPGRTAGVIADAASAVRQLGGDRHAARLYSMSLGDLFYKLGGDAERELQVVYQRSCLILGQGHRR